MKTRIETSAPSLKTSGTPPNWHPSNGPAFSGRKMLRLLRCTKHKSNPIEEY